MQTRGHLIFCYEGVWHKLYLAYNATAEYTLPILTPTVEFLENLLKCKTGVTSIDNYNGTFYPREYHDYKNFDHLKHPNEKYASLEEALKTCNLTNIFIFNGTSWEHKVLNEVNPDAKPEVRKRVNVWRERRKLKESKENTES